jgi:hypothetical protein
MGFHFCINLDGLSELKIHPGDSLGSESGMEPGSVDTGRREVSPPSLRSTVTNPSPGNLEGHPAGLSGVTGHSGEDGGGESLLTGASPGDESRMVEEGADLCGNENPHGSLIASVPSSEVEGIHHLPASRRVDLFIGHGENGEVWAEAQLTEGAESPSNRWHAHSAMNPLDGGTFSTTKQNRSALPGDFHRQAIPVHRRRTSHEVVITEPWMVRGLVSVRRRTLMPNDISSPAHSFLTRGQGGQELLEIRHDHQMEEGGESPPSHFFPETWTSRKLTFDEGAIESFHEFRDPTEHSWFFGEFLVRHYLRSTRWRAVRQHAPTSAHFPPQNPWEHSIPSFKHNPPPSLLAMPIDASPLPLLFPILLFAPTFVPHNALTLGCASFYLQGIGREPGRASEGIERQRPIVQAQISPGSPLQEVVLHLAYHRRGRLVYLHRLYLFHWTF